MGNWKFILWRKIFQMRANTLLLCGLKYTMLLATLGASSFSAANEVSLKAQLIAGRYTVIASGISSQVKVVNARDGELIKPGRLLVSLDCEALQASFSIAKAHISAASARYKSLSRLEQLNSASPLEVQLAAAEKAMAEGELAAVRAQIKYCDIKAPYQARVVARMVQPYQFVEPGTKLLQIYDPRSLEVQFVAPSSRLKSLQGKLPFSIYIDELGLNLTGTIVRVGGKVDPVSQTVQVYGELDSHPDQLLEGMSGVVTVGSRTIKR